ncbi:MAG: methyltransferase domain-containing protein [Proteobacteria bacterium]|nr:methyltransferase domain-containing protein [Pseudomonadota bacterium]
MSSAAPFDRRAVRLHRDRAARGFGGHDFLVRAGAERLAERLDELEAQFPRVLDLGCHGGELAQAVAGRAGIESIVLADPSPAMAARARPQQSRVVVAEEELLPFAPGSFDAVLSCLSLHWVNDLPGTLVQVREALAPGGLLLVSMLGGETLRELRTALAEADAAGGQAAAPRVSPFVDVRAAGDLAGRAGFVRPVADIETVTASYADPLRLMTELRGMGEANAHRDRPRRFTTRATLLRAAAAHATTADGRIPATFQIVTLTAWTPEAAGAAKNG